MGTSNVKSIGAVRVIFARGSRTNAKAVLASCTALSAEKLRAALVLPGLLLISLLSGHLLTAESAFAQEPRVSRGAEKAEASALRLSQKAKLAVGAERYAEAKAIYLKSLSLEENYEVHCLLAQALVELQEFPEAYYHLLICEELFPPALALKEQRLSYQELSYAVRSKLIGQEALGARARLDHFRTKAESSEETAVEVIAVSPKNAPVEQLSAPEDSAVKPVASKKKKIVVWGLFSLGVTTMATSIPLFLHGSAKKRKAKDLRVALLRQDANCLSVSEPCRELNQTLQAWDRSKNAATGLLLAGGATLLSAGLVQVFWNTAGAELGLQPLWSIASLQDYQVGLSGKF